MVADEDIKILEQQDMQTLAQWWCDLNTWLWPDEIPDPEDGKNWKARGRRGQLMAWIDDRIGPRVISRLHNKEMSDEEFNDFWRGFYEGHKESRKRYDARVLAKIRRSPSNTGLE